MSAPDNISMEFLRRRHSVKTLAKELDLPQEGTTYDAVQLLWHLQTRNKAGTAEDYNEAYEFIKQRIQWFLHFSHDFPLSNNEEAIAFSAWLLSDYSDKEIKEINPNLPKPVYEILHINDDPAQQLYVPSDFNERPAYQFALGLCLLERYSAIVSTSRETLIPETRTKEQLIEHSKAIMTDDDAPLYQLVAACRSQAYAMLRTLAPETGSEPSKPVLTIVK